MLRKNYLLIFLCFIGAGLRAQDRPIKQAFEYPTKEIYDLLVDRHGFIWVASDFGVARYDGINCVHFSSPLQISLGCSNLLEDSSGRIWFNNFNGQIFYIDHEKVNLVEGYNYKRESNYPRMVLFHDQLLVTSDRGLYVLNTKNLQGKYISSNTYTSSLAVLTDRVLVHGDKNWFLYDASGVLKKIPFIGDNQITGDVSTLANATYRDTAYMMANPSGTVKKLVIDNDTIKQVQQIKLNSFINTISVSPSDQMINTTDYSYSLKTGAKIKGYNLSDLVTDQEGNKWLSSLYYGLLIQYKKDITSKTAIPALDSNDLVISINDYKNQLLLGTKKGYLMLYNPTLQSTGFKIKISPNPGSINSITPVNKDEFIIAYPITTYKVNVNTKRVTELKSLISVKQVCYDDRATYIASSNGLFIIPANKSALLKKQIDQDFGKAFKYDSAGGYFYIKTRSRAVANLPDRRSLVVAFKNGLFQISNHGLSPFLYQGNQIYAASLSYIDHRLYIGTISNGMLIVEKNSIKHISVQNGLFSKSIFKIKPIDKNLWIIGSGPMQVFNTKKMALVNNYDFPDKGPSQVFDLDGLGQKTYLATSFGLNNFKLVKTPKDKKLKNYLLYVKINNEIYTPRYRNRLSYSENNLLFNIGIPSYLKAKDIYIKYCLVTETDSTWLATEPGERFIRFSSLMPGTYTLKAIAVDPRMGLADSMISYKFSIEPPWWSSLGFKIILCVIFIIIVLYGYITLLLKRLSLKKAFDTQQQLILTERQRISAEIHDDIGSGIFAIHLFADTASKNENISPEVVQIKNMVSDLAEKIREIIWSTDIGNDNLENLFYYTHFQINKLFEHSDIDFVSELPDNIIDLNITGQSRRNVYLLVKELVHNAIKHSKASRIELKMTTDEQLLYIYVIDNGIGISSVNTRPNSMGFKNVKSRVKKLNGVLSIENNQGAQISIEIPLTELMVIGFDKQLDRYQLLILGLLKISKTKSTTKND